jgi:hypothetical protein
MRLFDSEVLSGIFRPRKEEVMGIELYNSVKAPWTWSSTFIVFVVQYYSKH